MIVHGIESILLPGNTTSAATTTTAAATGPTASATTAAAPAGGNATKTGRHLLLSTEVLAAVDDSAAAGRGLLGWGWGFSGGPTAEMDAAQGAIEAAADGDESTAQAAQQVRQCTVQCSTWLQVNITFLVLYAICTGCLARQKKQHLVSWCTLCGETCVAVLLQLQHAASLPRDAMRLTMQEIN
jgi:hypothetical protein